MLRCTLGRVRRGCRRRRHRAGVPVRRSHSGRISGHGKKFRAPDRPQHPAAAARGVTRRPGAGSRRRVVVRRRPHRTARAAGLAALPGCRGPRRIRRRPRLRRRPDRRSGRAAHRRHRAPARPRSPASTNTPTWANPPLPQTNSLTVRRTTQRNLQRYAAEFEALRDRSDVFLARTGARPQALLLPLGPLAEHNIRTTFAVEPAGVGRHRGNQPGHRRRRRRRRGRRRLTRGLAGCGRYLRHRQPLRKTRRPASWRPPEAPAWRRSTWRARRRRWE